MKRSLGTAVLFVLLILTVVALIKIGTPKDTNALQAPMSAAVKDGTN